MRNRTLFIATLALTLLAAPAVHAAETVVQEEAGTLLLGTPGLGVGYAGSEDVGVTTNDLHGRDGVSYHTFDILSEAQGANFTLEATAGDGVFTDHGDLDIDFVDSAGNTVGSHFTAGDEEGTVPADAVQGEIFLFEGQDTQFLFQATTGS